MLTLPLSRCHPAFEMPADFGRSMTAPGELDDTFSYEMFPEEVANEARAAAEQIGVYVQQAQDAVVMIGTTLKRMKGVLAHGDFIPWCELEAKISTSTAQRYMAIATMFEERIAAGKLPTVGNLTLRDLAKLSARSFPKEVRNEILDSLTEEAPPNSATISKMLAAAKSARPGSMRDQPAVPSPSPLELVKSEGVAASNFAETVDPYPVTPAETDGRQEQVAPGVEVAKVGFTDINRIIERAAEVLLKAGAGTMVLEVVARIGNEALGKGLCAALRGEPLDDLLAEEEPDKGRRPFGFY